MDESDWYRSRENLKKLLETKKLELIRLKNDISEIEYCIETYAVKAGDYKPMPEKENSEPLGIA